MTEAATQREPRTGAIDWTIPRALYVYGVNGGQAGLLYMSITEVAATLGLRKETVAKRAADENWEAQREQAREEIYRKIGERRTDEIVERAAALDDRAARVFEAILTIVGNKLAVAHREKKELPTRELAELTRAAEIAHRGGRLALGEATERVELPKGAFTITGGSRVIDADPEALPAPLQDAA